MMIRQLMNKDFMNNVPSILLVENEWLTWYNKKKKDGSFTKPPLTQRGHTVESDSPGCSVEQALEDIKWCGEYGGGAGFKLNDRHDFVFFDVDHVKNINDLPKEFKEFLILQDSYMELSPSGEGLRIPFICRDKDKLPNKVNLIGMDGELFVRSGHVTITGNHLAGEDIKEITAYQLEEWFKPKKAEVIDIPVSFNHPEISLIKEALRFCKLNQCDRVKDAYKTIMKQEYNHYDYWLKIMSACHHYAEVTNQMNEITSMVVEWSQTDEIAFESDEDVITHWSSLSNKSDEEEKSGITYSTLMKFAKLLKFQWPEEKYDKNGNPTGKPIPTSLMNFDYLMDYYNIKMNCDIFDRSLYITGDKDIINKFYKSGENVKTYFGMAGPFSEKFLDAYTCSLAQQNGYNGVTVSSISQLYNNHIIRKTKDINMLKMWLETSPKDLTDDMIEKNTDISKSNLEYLISCIKFNPGQNIELATAFFSTFFYEMVMPIYNPERILSQRSFMLVLTGPEASRKTTFFTRLFPKNLRSQFVTNSTETLGGAKSIRDFSSSLVNSVLVVTDEFEIFYNKKNDSLFKTLVTSDVIDYVPIYEKTMKKQFKNSVLAGTTNKTSLPFEQDSNRRLAMVSIDFIDTNAMEEINWHHFYRHYVAKGKKAMMNGVFPWKLSDATIKKQYIENEPFRAQSNAEIILRETFDFDMQTHDKMIKYDSAPVQTNSLLYGINDIRGILLQRYPSVQIKPAELKHLLKRLCGKYTDTTGKIIQFKQYDGHIKDGIVRQGQWTKYVMPPQLTNF